MRNAASGGENQRIRGIHDLREVRTGGTAVQPPRRGGDRLELRTFYSIREVPGMREPMRGEPTDRTVYLPVGATAESTAAARVRCRAW